MAKAREKLSKKMMEAAQVEVLEPNIGVLELANRLGVHYNSISNWHNSPCYVEYREKLMKDVWKDATRKAQKQMISMIDSPDEKISIQASKYILDSAGYNAEQKINISGDMNYTVDYGDEE